MRDAIIRCAEIFDEDDYLPKADSLVRLVFEQWPSNTSYREVWAKAAVLNTIYRGGVIAVARLARYIAQLDTLDGRLADGDAEAVDLMRRGHGIVIAAGHDRDFYAFATKYCC